MYKVRMMISIFQGWPRKIPGSYTLVVGFLICHYTFQYTSYILCETGGILAGLWKLCIRNSTVAAGFLLCQVKCQYTVRILGESKGYTERGMDGMCTDFVYLMDNDPWFLATMKFVFRISSGRFYGYSFSNLSLETDS